MSLSIFSYPKMPHDHPYFVKNEENMVNHPIGFPMWNGWGSIAHNSGVMFRYILLKAASLSEKNIVISSCSDDMFPIPDNILEYAKSKNAVVIAPILCSFTRIKPRECMYIPASDEYFVKSIYDIFASYRVPWEKKIDSAVWRGGLSGEMLRIDTVKACLDIQNTDVKLVDNWPRDEYNPKKTPELFGDRIEAYDQCKYKAIFWIDGNCISSNVLWIFGSGSVPIIINETEYWFKKMLVPWVHYVPVRADLSDLKEKVAWIFDNDDEAHRIADNALEFCRTVLSPEGQRSYIDHVIDKHIKENQKPFPEFRPAFKHLFPYVTYGGLAHIERCCRKRISVMLECLDNYYKDGDSKHIVLFLKNMDELLQMKEFPEVHQRVLETADILKKEAPELLSVLEREQ